MKQTAISKLDVPGPFIPQLQHRLYFTQNQCFNVNQLITIIVQILRLLYNLLIYSIHIHDVLKRHPVITIGSRSRYCLISVLT
jgi:hypothetical protein